MILLSVFTSGGFFHTGGLPRYLLFIHQDDDTHKQAFRGNVERLIVRRSMERYPSFLVYLVIPFLNVSVYSSGSS